MRAGWSIDTVFCKKTCVNFWVNSLEYSPGFLRHFPAGELCSSSTTTLRLYLSIVCLQINKWLSLGLTTKFFVPRMWCDLCCNFANVFGTAHVHYGTLCQLSSDSSCASQSYSITFPCCNILCRKEWAMSGVSRFTAVKCVMTLEENPPDVPTLGTAKQ